MNTVTTPTPTAAPLVCPRCGGDDLTRDDGDRAREYTCRRCGARSRQTRRGVLLRVGWACDGCGHDNEQGNAFCTGCGAALTKPCPHCGAVMRVSDVFCTQCGKSRSQIVAEWYRTGRGALDAGRPWEAIPPLSRLHALDPEYGDIPNLLARAYREAAQKPPPSPLPPPSARSPAAEGVRALVAQARTDGRQRQRLATIAGIVTLVLAILASVVGYLMGSAAFGVLLFCFLMALIAVNVWAAISNL